MSALKWRQVSEYAAESDRGGYTVCRKHACGAIFYEAWRGPVFLQSAEDADSSNMRAVCEQDWKQRQAVAA